MGFTVLWSWGRFSQGLQGFLCVKIVLEKVL